MKILITGADGFIGSHLTEYLLKKNLNVRATILYNSFGKLGWLNDLKHKNLDLHIGDIRDQAFCDKVIKNVDIVINLAALVSIPYSYESTEAFVDTNIKGLLNICRSSKKFKVKKLIQFSTSEVYGTAKYTPIDEKHPFQPQSPYSATKIAADALSLSYYYSHDINVTIARPFNTYGPRQSERAIIPTIISQMLNGNKKIKLGNIHTKRDLTYVTDTCHSIYLLIKNYKKFAGETFNIGSNNSVSIQDLFKKIKLLLNSNASIFVEKKRFRPSKSEVNLLVCNNNKFKRFLNYKPKIKLSEGLSLTIDWFKKNPDKRSMSTKYHI